MSECWKDLHVALACHLVEPYVFKEYEYRVHSHAMIVIDVTYVHLRFVDLIFSWMEYRSFFADMVSLAQQDLDTSGGRGHHNSSRK